MDGRPAAGGQRSAVAGQQVPPATAGEMAGPAAALPLGLNQLPSTATSAAGELIAIIGTGAAALYAARRCRR